MTVHVGLANGSDAVLLSDSQGSTATDEFHGWQKQFAGNGFVVGVAGDGLILSDLMPYLAARAFSGADVHGGIETYFRDEVHPNAAPGAVVIVIAAPAPLAPAEVRTFYPGSLRRFTAPTSFGSIGSGSVYASRAAQRDAKLGVVEPLTTLGHLFARAEGLADAANESLTVDDQLMCGFLHKGQSYLLGHAGIRLSHVPDELKTNWPQASATFATIKASAETLRSESAEAHRGFSLLRGGSQGTVELAKFMTERLAAIKMHRENLDNELVGYMAWYDGLLGRTAAPDSEP